MDIILKFFNRVSVKDRSFFMRQLATMLDSGLPISQSLTIIASQTTKKRFKQIINKIIEDVESGLSFSTAISAHKNVFSRVEIAVVRSGEASGKLVEVLDELAKVLETDVAFNGKIKSALAYPGFILFAMIVVVYIMMTRVLPSLTGVFTEANVALPWTTRFLMSLSYFMVKFWWLIILGFFGSIYGARLYFATPEGTMTWSRLAISLPIFGALNRKIYMSRFTRTMGMLITSGVPIIEAIEVVASVMDNKIYSNILTKAARDVERGVPLSVPIGKSDAFPQIVPQMILVGEQTGRMDQILTKLSSYFDQEVDSELKGMLSLIEPALLILVGLGVAFIVFAIIVPIYNISSAIN